MLFAVTEKKNWSFSGLPTWLYFCGFLFWFCTKERMVHSSSRISATYKTAGLDSGLACGACASGSALCWVEVVFFAVFLTLGGGSGFVLCGCGMEV